MKIAYSPWGGTSSVFPFDELFDKAVDAKAEGLGGADAFLLWGGTDVHPSLYNQRAHPYNQAPKELSIRDAWEWKALIYCKVNKIPVIGVCRGAQLLCVFNGGALIQHVNNHNTDHIVVDVLGDRYSVTSSHHQMMDLEGTQHSLVAWTPVVHSNIFYGATSETPAHITKGLSTGSFSEPEVVYFPNNNSLAIQGHPEWAHKDSTFVKKTLHYVTSLLNKETV